MCQNSLKLLLWLLLLLLFLSKKIRSTKFWSKNNPCPRNIRPKSVGSKKKLSQNRINSQNVLVKKIKVKKIHAKKTSQSSYNFETFLSTMGATVPWFLQPVSSPMVDMVKQSWNEQTNKLYPLIHFLFIGTLNKTMNVYTHHEFAHFFSTYLIALLNKP